jgi:UDP-glucose 4-epimerase
MDKAEVVVLDNLRTGFKRNLEGLPVTFVEGDIQDEEAVRSCMEGVDIVFHLAAMVSVPESVESPEACIRDNDLGTVNVLQQALECKVGRVVFASSAAVYGDNPEVPKLEKMLPEPKSPYAITKLDGEYYMEFYKQYHGLSTACLRFFNVFGPGQNPKGPYASAVPVFITRAIENEPITVFGDGTQTRDFIFVQDIVSALSFLAELKEVSGVFNAGYGNSTRIDSLAEMILEQTGSSSVVTNGPERAGDVKHSYASADQLRALGWEPQWSFEDALKVTISSYMESYQAE